MHSPRHSVSFWGGVLAILVSLIGGAAPAPGQTSPQTNRPVQGPVHALHLTVDLVPLSGTIQPGGSTEVGLHFLLDKGWHVYWRNAGDSGEPPRIQWKLPRGLTAGPVQFPAPQRLPLGPLMDFGYENEVLFPMTLHATQGLKAPASEQLTAHVDWLVCREVCIPGKADLALPLKVSTAPGPSDPTARALFDRFHTLLPQPLPPAARAVFAKTGSGFTLALTGSAGQPRTSAQFFPLDQGQLDNVAPQPVRAIDNGLEILLKKDDNLRGPLAQLSGVVHFADGTAYEVHATPGGVPPVEDTTVSGPLTPGPLTKFLRFVFLAFVGGMVLNLMPCVFPVLFLKGLSLVKSSNEDRSRLRMHGLVYTLGILVSFWTVVAVLLALRAGGRQLGWGFQFQSPIFIAIVAMLLFFLGLSLAGMFEIGLTVTSTGSSLAAQQGYAGSFFTGVLAMIVATPCTAPFMGAAIGFALTQSALVAFGVFTALAIGLAAPYLLFTLNPSWTRVLPRPGAWMEIFKQFTAVPIFATVIWLVWLFAQAAGANAMLGLLSAFLVLAIAGWILGRWPARRSASLAALLVIAIAVAVPVYVIHVFMAPERVSASSVNASWAGNQDGWQPFSQAALDQYRAQGRPVFVDFTAAWCLSCQVNERVVLDRTDVRQRLRKSGIVLMRADWTRHDEEIAQALNKLGRSGVPTYVLYAPGAPAQVLPEVLTPGIVLSAINQLQARL
jgi:thiol:disulfide interchange protein/DsbC/DsbD-like thiol-disulfide interchange protein